MCFSNLPVEFDENGDPYLAAEADDVTQPGADGHDGSPECGCDGDAAVDLAAEPEAAFDAILAEMPERARAHLTGTAETEGGDDPARAPDRAEGD